MNVCLSVRLSKRQCLFGKPFAAIDVLYTVNKYKIQKNFQISKRISYMNNWNNFWDQNYL